MIEKTINKIDEYYGTHYINNIYIDIMLEAIDRKLPRDKIEYFLKEYRGHEEIKDVLNRCIFLGQCVEFLNEGRYDILHLITKYGYNINKVEISDMNCNHNIFFLYNNNYNLNIDIDMIKFLISHGLDIKHKFGIYMINNPTFQNNKYLTMIDHLIIYQKTNIGMVLKYIDKLNIKIILNFLYCRKFTIKMSNENIKFFNTKLISDKDLYNIIHDSTVNKIVRDQNLSVIEYFVLFYGGRNFLI